MGLRDGGPPALSWAGRSRSERESKAQLTVGPTGGDQPNNQDTKQTLLRNKQMFFSRALLEADVPVVPILFLHLQLMQGRMFLESIKCQQLGGIVD